MMLKQIFLASFTFIALSWVSCSETEGAKDAAAQSTETDAMLLHTSPASPGVPNAQSATVVTPAAGQQQPANAGTVQTAATGAAQTAKTAAGMNPPHGQPGHRCDINVGAPLNTPPPATTAATQQPQVVTQTAPPPEPVKTAPGMNPPHGQPGHDCKIAVGAPLNSSPDSSKNSTN